VLKTIFRYLLRFFAGIIVFILAWLILAFLLPYITISPDPVKEAKTNTIFIRSNGVHTDFVMPVKTEFNDWSELLPYSDYKNTDETFRYISFGWGDKGFYIHTPTWADLKFSTAFKAAFGLGGTAMHVTYNRYAPKLNENCKKIQISERQYKLLIDYINNSFQKKKSKFILIDHPGYNNNDRFYEAEGKYNLVKTCNAWTGRGLYAIGEKTGIWTPTARSVLQNIR
jgi:uncharacterized protein (TIGR02117 family)